MKHRKITSKEVDLAREFAKVFVNNDINHLEILKDGSLLVGTNNTEHKIVIHNDILNNCMVIEKSINEVKKEQEEDEEDIILLELRGLTLDDIY